MKRILAGTLVTGAVGAACLVSAMAQKSPVTKGFVKGPVELQAIGALSFGPDGVLAIADPKAGAVICVETGDTKPDAAKQTPVANVDAVLAAKLGAPAAGIRINDLQANPASGTVYVSVTKLDDQKPVLMKFDRAGGAQVVALDNVRHGRVALPTKEGVRLNNITDLEFSKSRILVAAHATEQFASKVYSIPLPFAHNSNADVFSTETFHVSHNKLETGAPISTLTSYHDGKQDVVGGAFACTPVVKYPVNQLGPDAKVRGTAVIELGSRNRPLDLFFYKKGGQEWLLVANNNHGVLKVTAAVFKETERVDEKALHRKKVGADFPPMEGVEVISALNGTLEMSKVDEARVAVLRKTDAGLSLEVTTLP